MSSIITYKKYEEVVQKPYSNDAVVRNDFPGFKEDYLVVHCLIKRFKPSRIMEIGTSTGSGTRVICNAMGIKWWHIWKRSLVCSIDVPPGTDPTIIYPGHEDGHPLRAGSRNNLPYTQLFGDSTTYNFASLYPIEGWFIDGKHDYKYASKDTRQALKSNPQLILWHDMQIKEVEQAVEDTMKNKPYKVYRIGNTRVGYAIRLEK